MHELSIVQDLFKLCETNAMQNASKQICKIEIQIGRLSGVEPYYLKNAFDAFKMIECADCGFNSYIELDEFLCPNCKSKNIKVTAGEDILLMRLEMI